MGTLLLVPSYSCGSVLKQLYPKCKLSQQFYSPLTQNSTNLLNYYRKHVSKLGIRSGGNASEVAETDNGKTAFSGSAYSEVSGGEYRPENWEILSACLVGLLTGVGVVIFNNGVHEIRDFVWDGIPSRGASWLREEPTEVIWHRVVGIPVCGGVFVAMLNVLRDILKAPAKTVTMSKVYVVLEPVLKTVAACVTLGTGNSLGPEGPSVEIGSSIARGIGSLLDRSTQRKLSLVAAGSAAGISSGFNAAVAGCFFAVESVLWPSPMQSSSSLTNATSMVILSAVIASVVSEIGLGSQPAFTVPEYDFRSPSELPLYLLLGVLCGLVSVSFSKCTSFVISAVDNISESTSIPKTIFPVLGSLSVGLTALAYPEILYWGFQNVDILLESRPFVKGLSADLLVQLVAVKIVATSICRGCGLVGGYYAPSLFIGAATGMAYGKLVTDIISQSNPVFHLSILEVASPQAYGLVGMAATLAGVCQVPLTSVLLLFELTQDYRIVLPLLGAVGISSWITSGYFSRKEGNVSSQPDSLSSPESVEKSSSGNDLCVIDSSLCVDYSTNSEDLERRILVSQAMKTRYLTTMMGTFLIDVVNLMLAEMQSCAMVVDDGNLLIGVLTLGDIQEYTLLSKGIMQKPEELLVSEVCRLLDEKCLSAKAVTPDMTLYSARRFMTLHGLTHLAVITKHIEAERGLIVGLLDDECISLACRALATRESLNLLILDKS